MIKPVRDKSIRTVLVYTAPLCTFVALLALLNLTHPLTSGPLSILAVFILMYALILSLLGVLWRIVSFAVQLINPRIILPLRRGYYVLSVVSLAPVLLIALNTLGQLDILECLLIFILIGLGCFYILRRTAK